MLLLYAWKADHDKCLILRQTPDLPGQGGTGRVPVEGDGQPVVMAGGKAEISSVLPAEIQFHIPGAGIGCGALTGGVLHAPFPADGRGKAALRAVG